MGGGVGRTRVGGRGEDVGVLSRREESGESGAEGGDEEVRLRDTRNRIEGGGKRQHKPLRDEFMTRPGKRPTRHAGKCTGVWGGGKRQAHKFRGI